MFGHEKCVYSLTIQYNLFPPVFAILFITEENAISKIMTVTLSISKQDLDFFVSEVLFNIFVCYIACFSNLLVIFAMQFIISFGNNCQTNAKHFSNKNEWMNYSLKITVS